MQSVPKVAIRSQGAPRVTQVEVTRTCGHVEMLEVRGDPARSAFLDNARLRVCGKCYRQSQTERDAAAVAEGKRCALEGSERQIAWAQSIRQKRAVEFGNALNDATAWAKGQIEKGGFTVEFGKKRTKTVQQAIADFVLRQGDVGATRSRWARVRRAVEHGPVVDRHARDRAARHDRVAASPVPLGGVRELGTVVS
jgi:hypothetical protein